MSKEKTIALIGNPNTGKSTLFNALTGLKQKIANYPGVTVEKKEGYASIGDTRYRILDLPGIYSLNPKQIDERITCQVLAGTYLHESGPDLVIAIVDAANLERNLYLVTQVMDLGIPMIIALNMTDLAESRGISTDAGELSKNLGVPVIPMMARNPEDVQKLRDYISSGQLKAPKQLQWNPDGATQEAIDFLIREWIQPFGNIPKRSQAIEALRLIADQSSINAVSDGEKEHILREKIRKARNIIEASGKNPEAEEVLKRYEFIEECISEAVTKSEEEEETLSDKIDTFTTHKLFGPLIFAFILLLMFQSIFTWAEPFMNLIDLVFIETGVWLETHLPDGMLNDLLVEGVIAGLGGVVIFLPQIIFLFFFISVLESTGYMARAAFVMDGFMSRIGLHGRSVVPLVSGFACAIPGIMATRTIENRRDRIITIMILPFMACSARLPVYALMIAAFIPDTGVLGLFSLQGITFFALYIFGIVMAILAAFIMKLFIKTEHSSPLMMELPAYKMPQWPGIFQNVFDRGKVFVTEAGKIIFGISILLWFLSSFPKQDHAELAKTEFSTETIELSSFQESEVIASARLEQSYAGQFGQFIEPAIEPLGFDWKIGIGLITSFAAREVMVGTLNTIYSVQDQENAISLQKKLQRDVDSETGEPVYTIWTALSLMVFFALAMQCMSTIAIVKRETNSWKWPVLMFSYMTALAYLCSLIVYQVGSSLS